MKKIYRSKATIKGIVQGIGFRPFIYNLAGTCGLCGYVLNNSRGVELEIEGALPDLERFFDAIKNNPLPLAHITSISKELLPPVHYQDFTIRDSVSAAGKSVLIAPDICVCEDCLREMNDAHDRRYRYPFINCTNCGPRYTIIKDVPYDRPNTSMHVFAMCEKCSKEYHDPADRRFHAQPNACPICGPAVEIFDANRSKVHSSDPISTVIEYLLSGYIVAVKGLGGFHLAVNAEDNNAVSRLRRRKMREEKPLALMSKTLTHVHQYAEISTPEKNLLQSAQRPIVLLKKNKTNAIAPAVSPNNTRFGVMLPYTPLHHLLLENGISTLVMTSGNLSDEPIAIDNDESFDRLGEIADYFLIHDRDIYLRSDDSICRVLDRKTRQIRRSRGYVPTPIFLNRDFPRILALGAELKNTICLTKGRHAFLSQHIGDLKNTESYEFLRLTIGHLQRILDIEPELLAYDLHPDYLSTQLAGEFDCVAKVAVQHHHAHIASCVQENSVDGPVIGLALDGTGYGTDGNIWGGEVLLVDGEKFSRLGYFDYVPMPGGDVAIREPWRMAISYLYNLFGHETANLNIPAIASLDREKLKIIMQMIDRKMNCPLTSSLGRLFDGIAAMTGICQYAAFEGQPAISLEMALTDSSSLPYRYSWESRKDSLVISPVAIIKDVVNDLQQGIAPGIISYKFHITLIMLFRDICCELRVSTGIDRIVLSGGVFQNAFLFSGLKKALEKEKFKVYSHSRVPANDGGISLGQAAVAALTLTK